MRIIVQREFLMKSWHELHPIGGNPTDIRQQLSKCSRKIGRCFLIEGLREPFPETRIPNACRGKFSCHMVQCAGDFDSKPVSKKGIPPWPLCQAERLKNSRASEISDPEETPADEDLIQKIDLENL